MVRGDSGFAHKELYELCETLDTTSLIRLKANAQLYRLAKEVTNHLLGDCSLNYFQQFYAEFEYQAKSWNKPRRVMVQVRGKAGELLPESLFLVTHMETWPELLVSLYAKRGTMENDIKECKNGFRRLTLPKDYAQIKIETLRTKFIKIETKRVKQARRIIFKWCSHYLYKEAFNQCLRNIHVIQLESF